MNCTKCGDEAQEDDKEHMQIYGTCSECCIRESEMIG